LIDGHLDQILVMMGILTKIMHKLILNDLRD
jgi:hypothetical protein